MAARGWVGERVNLFDTQHPECLSTGGEWLRLIASDDVRDATIVLVGVLEDVLNTSGQVLRAELWSHFWPNCDGRDLGLFFGVLAELS